MYVLHTPTMKDKHGQTECEQSSVCDEFLLDNQRRFESPIK